jgi:hypothetical protein
LDRRARGIIALGFGLLIAFSVLYYVAIIARSLGGIMHFAMVWVTVTALLLWCCFIVGIELGVGRDRLLIALGLWLFLSVIEAVLECFGTSIITLLIALLVGMFAPR